MKKQIIISGIIAFIAGVCFAQNTDSISVIDHIAILQNPDSVVVSFYLITDKETSFYSDDNIGSIRFHKSAVLSSKEYVTLSKYLLSVKSYHDRYAVLNHNDINIKYYKNGIICNDIYISSITRNITVHAQQMILKKQITERFEKHLTNLLRKKKIWNKENSFEKF
jgi:hypothetical protein